VLRLFFGLSTLILLVGCSSKEDQALFRLYSENQTYNKYLKHTEKATLSKGEQSKIVLMATYLYPAKFKEREASLEKFIVGVIFDEPDISSLTFKNKTESGSYRLILKNSSAVHVEKLALTDKRLKDIPFVSEWGTYYEVAFPHIESKSFSLVLTHPKYGTKKLLFSKVAKFVYSKSLF